MTERRLSATPSAIEVATEQGGFDWTRQVEAKDYRDYVANLRSIRCPENTIRDIVMADMNAAFEARLRERLTGLDGASNYWAFADNAVKSQSRPFSIRKELEAEKKNLLAALLKLDDEAAEAASRIKIGENIHKLAPAPGYISPENAETFQRLEQRFGQTKKQLQLRSKETGMNRVEQRKHQRVLDEQFEGQLLRKLSPAEVRAHMLRGSYLAEELRNRLIVFKPSQAEFAALYDLLRDDPHLSITAGTFKETSDGPNNEYLRKLLKGALGAERYGQLEAAMDTRVRVQQRLQSNRKLDEGTARQAADLTVGHWAALEAVRADADLSELQKQQRIQTLKSEHEAELARLGAATPRQEKRRARRQEQKAKEATTTP